MFFNLDTGKVDSDGILWLADEWIHVSCKHFGMISIFMPKRNLLNFINFLSEVITHPNGHVEKHRDYIFQSEPHDESRVNIFIQDKTWIILNIKVEYISNLILYLKAESLKKQKRANKK